MSEKICSFQFTEYQNTGVHTPDRNLSLQKEVDEFIVDQRNGPKTYLKNEVLVMEVKLHLGLKVEGTKQFINLIKI